MESSEGFVGEPADTREELLLATYEALCAHGYADLTVDRIAAAFPKSKSLIYHHYDGKDDLLLDFLDFALERFEATVPLDPPEDAPDAHLREVLDHVLASSLSAERREFAAAMVDLRAQAASDERFRAAFSRHDRFFRERFAAILRAGIDAGVYREVDPEATAATLVTLVNGAMTERVTTDDAPVEAIRAEVERFLEATLRRES